MRVGSSKMVVAGVAAVLLVSCGSDGDGGEPAASADTGVNESTPEAVGTTAAPPDDTMSDDGSAVDEPAGTAAVEVNPSALPTDPSGFDTLAADLCALYAVEDLDAFFGGEGELATSEPIDGGCKWSVEGFPKSHYVEVSLTGEGKVDGVAEGERVERGGVEVHVQRGPGDAWATVPTPDGQFVAIRVHGSFGTDGRALDGALDPAALGLADNLVGRL